MPSRVSIHLWVVAGLLMGIPAQTQSPSKAPPLGRSPDQAMITWPTYEEQYSEEGGFYFRKLSPEEIPKDTLVFHLFHDSLSWMTHEPAPKWYHVYLKKIGLEPGSEAADIYTLAVLDAAEIIRDNSKKEPDHVDNWDWKAENLGVIYGKLLVDLEAAGVPASVMEAFLEGEVLAGTSVRVNYDNSQETWFPDMERRRDLFDKGLVRGMAIGAERGGDSNGKH